MTVTDVGRMGRGLHVSQKYPGGLLRGGGLEVRPEYPERTIQGTQKSSVQELHQIQSHQGGNKLSCSRKEEKTHQSAVW